MLNGLLRDLLMLDGLMLNWLLLRWRRAHSSVPDWRRRSGRLLSILRVSGRWDGLMGVLRRDVGVTWSVLDVPESIVSAPFLTERLSVTSESVNLA